MLMSIILFIFIFTTIALAHEGGHYIAAKKAGMRVLEFGIGFGPRLFGKEYKGTVYSINLIPILAFVSIAGMDDSKDFDEKQIPNNEKYFAATPKNKFLMAFTGPLMNIILAFILLSFIFGFFGVPQSISPYIDQVQPGSIAEKSGLKHNDKILELNDQKIIKMENAIDIIHKSANKEVKLKILRGKEVFTIKVIPKYNARFKFAVIGFTPMPVYEKVNPLLAIYYGAKQTLGLIALMFVILFQLITGGISLTDLAGPVGIAQVTGKYANSGFLAFMNFAAFLNVNVGILNLLPLPALDGGHIVFALIEQVTKRPVKEDLQRKVHQWGMIFLLTLMFLVTVNDLLRIFKH